MTEIINKHENSETSEKTPSLNPCAGHCGECSCPSGANDAAKIQPVAGLTPPVTTQPVYQIHARFRDRSKLINCYSFDGGIKEDANCVVATEDGPQFGHTVKLPKLIADGKTDGLMKLIRIATTEDIKHYYENIQKEKEAYKACQQKIEEKNIEMKLVEVDYSLDRSKIVFYFTAEKRTDFRELVKDLAYLLKARIEMRQIGVRDEAKMLGGYGCCGRELCCVSFLKDFVPVTIKMAKEQHLPLNQTKISGMCGRLMCCLAYEQGQYDSIKKAALANTASVQAGVNTPNSAVVQTKTAAATSFSSNKRQNNRQQRGNNRQNRPNKEREQGNNSKQGQKSWYNSQNNRPNNPNNRETAVLEPRKPAAVQPPASFPSESEENGEKK
ncbi:MAG: regulatory iron-sulfur-containing complex subunit RicT [Candidatus Firestonebacteria bacterium]|nr:regulatory iron-sulfur-containing complex subunit RicT [Candidatus Firestonebacteria bacterium]